MKFFIKIGNTLKVIFNQKSNNFTNIDRLYLTNDKFKEIFDAHYCIIPITDKSYVERIIIEKLIRKYVTYRITEKNNKYYLNMSGKDGIFTKEINFKATADNFTLISVALLEEFVNNLKYLK